MGSPEKRAIVVGGGIVGSVQALLLARIGYRVVVVDAAAKPTPASEQPAPSQSALSVRTVAMSCRSQQLLQSAGLWQEHIGCPIHTVTVNDKGYFGSVNFDRRDYAVPALGYVVPNQRLEAHLNALIAETPGVDVISPATATLSIIDSDRAEVAINAAHGHSVEVAGLIIAADGTHSSIREQLGIEVETTDYQQHALVANLTCQRPHQHVAYERFTGSGPLAILPLDKRTVAVVCTLDSSSADDMQRMTDEALLVELQQRFGGRLGRFQQIGRRAVFPLSLVRAKQQVKGCGVLVGNASVTLHPVAGQGLNLALRDVFELTAQLAGARSVTDALDSFTAARRGDQNAVVRQTDLLAKWFRRRRGPVAGPLHLARVSSMLMLDTLPVLRNRFGRRNAGIDIPLSNLNDARWHYRFQR